MSGVGAIGFPADTPFGFELALVRRQQRDGAGVLLNERSRAGPMNEDIPRPGKGVACRLQAQGVILCLEHPPWYRSSKGPIRSTTSRRAAAQKRGTTRTGVCSPAWSIASCWANWTNCSASRTQCRSWLPRGAVRPRTDQPDGRIGKVIAESGQPFGRDDRVVVKKDNLALGCGEPLVDPSAAAASGIDLSTRTR